MSLTQLEQHIYAYYVAGDAELFNAAPRFWPHRELVLILADKIAVATRKFGFKVSGKASTVARELLDDLIAAGAYSTKNNEFGGTMHQFQGDAYKRFLEDRRANDPIILQAKSEGAKDWAQTFAALTGA